MPRDMKFTPDNPEQEKEAKKRALLLIMQPSPEAMEAKSDKEAPGEEERKRDKEELRKLMGL